MGKYSSSSCIGLTRKHVHTHTHTHTHTRRRLSQVLEDYDSLRGAKNELPPMSSTRVRVDKDVPLFKELFSIDDRYSDMSPLVLVI